MKKTLLNLCVLSFGLILMAGLFIIYPKSTQAVAVTGINVNVCVTASDNSPISGASVQYKLGSTNNFGITNGDGCVTKNFPLGTTNLEVWASWNHTTSAHITKNISVDPTFNFQTILLTLRLETCPGVPLDGGNPRYGIGSTYNTWWFSGGVTGSSGTPGESYAEFFPGTYSFEMNYKATADTKLNVVIPNTNTTLTWQTTKVTLYYSGQISYGGVAGDSTWFIKPSMELLPGTYRFHFRPITGWGGGTYDFNLSGCSFEKTIAVSKLIVQKTTVPGGNQTVFNIIASGDGTITGGGAGTVTDAIDKEYEVTPGTYSVAEIVPAGWDKTDDTCQNVSIAAGQTATCTITNTKLPTLTLVKTVNNNYGGTEVVSDFILKIDDNPVTSGVANTVNVGAHTASEVNLFGYSTSSWGTDCAENGTITLAAGENKVCTITNNDIQPILTIVKHVINDNGGDKLAGDFTMNVSGPTLLSFFGVEDPGVTNNVNVGSYTIMESGPEGYALSYLGYCDKGGNLSLNIGENKDCTLTNDDKSPHLTTIVHVITDNGGSLLAPETAVDVTGSNVLPNSTFAGDEEGYTVSLDANTSYSTDANDITGYTKTLSSECSGTLNLNENRTCTITFNDIQPKLTVTKVVVNDNSGTKVVADFPLFVGETSITSDDQNGFDVGTYIVSETQQTGYVATISGDCDIQTGSINLQLGDIKSCTITNDDQLGTLIVKKTLINDNGGTATTSDFSFSVNEGDSVAFEADGQNDITVNAGTYTVTESAATGYSTTYDNCTKVVVSNGGSATCTITNTNNDIIPPTPPAGGGGGGGISAYSLLSEDAQKFDLNKDGKIDILDLNILMVHWGETGGGIGDFNGDGVVDILDFGLLMVNWIA